EDYAEALVDQLEGGAEALARGLVDLADGAPQAVDGLRHVGALGGQEALTLVLLVVLLDGEDVDRSQALEDRLAAGQLGLELREVVDRRRRLQRWRRRQVERCRGLRGAGRLARMGRQLPAELLAVGHGAVL